MTRAEHLAWCKQRALEYLDTGDIYGAMASMLSDLRKDPQTADHSGIEIGMMEAAAGLMRTKQDVQRWIEGFN